MPQNIDRTLDGRPEVPSPLEQEPINRPTQASPMWPWTTQVDSDELLALEKQTHEAVESLARGAVQPAFVAKTSAELCWHLSDRLGRYSWRFEYLDGELWIWHDTEAIHERARLLLSSKIACFLREGDTCPIDCGATMLWTGAPPNKGIKEPDVCWALREDGPIITIGEVVWGHQDIPSLHAQMTRWCASGRNAIGLKMWYKSAAGNAATLRSLDPEEDPIAEATTLASVLLIAKSAEGTHWETWRVGQMAESVQWPEPTVDHPGTMALLPGNWFMRRPRLAQVPIFLSEIQEMIGVQVAALAGRPLAPERSMAEASVQEELRRQDTVLHHPDLSDKDRNILLDDIESQLNHAQHVLQTRFDQV